MNVENTLEFRVLTESFLRFAHFNLDLSGSDFQDCPDCIWFPILFLHLKNEYPSHGKAK